jgi:hypothetical protein
MFISFSKCPPPQITDRCWGGTDAWLAIPRAGSHTEATERSPMDDVSSQLWHMSASQKHLSLKTKLNSVILVRERTMPTERPPLVGEVSANFCG